MKTKLLAVPLMLLLCSAASYAKDYKVKSGDTLSAIAENLKLAGTTTKGMMNAIYSNNPLAFINEDINVLKRGVTLQIPANKTEIQRLADSYPHLTSNENSTSEIHAEIADIKKEILAVIESMATSKNVLEKNVSNL